MHFVLLLYCCLLAFYALGLHGGRKKSGEFDLLLLLKHENSPWDGHTHSAHYNGSFQPQFCLHTSE